MWLRTVTPPLGAATLGAALAMALLMVCLAGPASQAAPLNADGLVSAEPSAPGPIGMGAGFRRVTMSLSPVNAAPPIPTLLRPANGSWTNQPNVEFAWSDVGAPTYNLRVDGVVYTTTVTSMGLALADGQHTWTVQARSAEGDASGYAAGWTVNVDTTPPPKPSLIRPADDTFTSTTSIEFGWSDVGASTYNLKVDGTVYPISNTSMTRVLGDGAHTWTVESIDALGNKSGYADEWTVTLDTTPPPVPALVGPADGAYINQADVEFSWSDVGAPTYHLRVDGVVYVTRDTSLTQTLADGTHDWTVQALDWLGNASGYVAESTVTVDTTPPPAPALAAPANGTATRNSNISFSWQNVGAHAYNLRVDGVVYTTTATSMTRVLGDGALNWTVRSMDWLGNASAYVPAWTVTVDTTSPPVPALISPADSAYTNQSSVEFRWQDVGGSTYNLRVDGVVYTTTATSMTRTLADGAHDWTVQALDGLGNASGYAAEWTVNVDTTPPPVPALAAPANGTATVNSNVTFSWQNVNSHSYNLRVDGVVYTTTVTSMPLELDDGTHTWTVRSRDWLGNASAYATAWTVTVDTTPPPVPTLLFPANDTATRDPSVQFAWSNVGASTYNLKVDGTVYPTSNTSMTRVLAEGVHTWTVQALDALGNASAYASPWTVTVDYTPPPVPALISPADGAFSTSSSVQFTWSSSAGATLYNLRVDGVVYATPGTSMTRVLADGAHTWAVQAQDWLGNASGYSNQRTVTVDTARPLATIVAPVNGAVLTTTHLYTVTISGTASDVGTGLDHVEVNTGAAWKTASGTSNWTYAWALPRIDNLPGALKVRSFDRAGNESDWSQVAVTVDTVAPTISSAPVPDHSPWVTPTVVYDWPSSADGSGIGRYRVHIYSTGGYDAVFDAADSRYVFTQATQQSEGYYARVQAVDGRGNWGAWSAFSVVVIPDLTPPTIWGPFILETSPYLHAVGTQLYYTNTMPSQLGQTFTVLGYADDGPSGVNRVCFSPAFGEQPACDTSGFQPWQSTSPNYEVERGTTASGAIVATVYDHADNTVQQTYSYALDGTPPDSTASAPVYATSSPIRVAWAATDAQSGVHSVDLWYKYGSSGAWTYAQTRLAGQESFQFVPPGDAPGTYYFGTVARDNLGNLERGVTVADTQTVYDKSTPTSAVTWAPAYWNKPGTPITMTWVATPSLVLLKEVRLWYRFNQGAWYSTTVASSGAATSGVFSFALAEGNGRYDLGTVARDVSGKSEADPYNSGDATTWFDTAINAPTGLACIPAGWARDNSFTVRWENPADLTGIAAAYYKVGAAPGNPGDGTRVPGDDREQIVGLTLPSEGLHTVWVWLEDKAGNIDEGSARGTSCNWDASVGAPSGLASTPAGWTATDAFTVTWTNPTDWSGIAGAYWKLDSAPTGPADGTWVPGVDLDRIGGLEVSREGSHTLYLWLGDVAGNIGLDGRRTVSLLYDPTPPRDVSITAPVSATTTSFVVYWSANGAASGILRYTVEYSGVMDSEWQPWLPSTTETSGLFTASLADTEYLFRVTAYDRAGSSERAQTRVYVEPQRAYLPVLRNRWRDWYRYDIYEPNDAPSDAYGPLKSGQTYQSFIWNAEDTSDYYYFVPISTQQVRIVLTNIPAGNDYDLYVYHLVGGQYPLLWWSNGTGSGPEYLDFVPTPGTKYFVRVYPFKGYSSTQPYHLTVTYK
jgi:hypothetical protein